MPFMANLCLQGCRIVPKVPNLTSISQEMDQLFAFFKSIFQPSLEKLTEYWLRTGGKSIGCYDIGFLVFGGKAAESSCLEKCL